MPWKKVALQVGLLALDYGLKKSKKKTKKRTTTKRKTNKKR
ncbi:hypothetical protein RRV45_15025 [Bacillus sp. DTU_2020_1000418_1_SI_GHA_SEK_038]|nr:hypothetical protein [Bacillus sp. DTU_2020_1000418_1_SI_GHA_SEK_038]WNS74222.1 hypothetical protein RRV45_15025 [Bacillus sp. DTU_2020_1000418_1_SI_GHA_SEK_038]